ncbi:MAG: class I SAM-dependent methyltransferase [Deltaproteobacteria bacterium]|nr:class I SAM-dependent methyltransferase [Deltaproteobacteria bacterium]
MCIERLRSILVNCISGLVAAAASVGCASERGHGHGHEHGHGHGHGHEAVHHSFSDAERWAKKFDDPGRDAWQMPDAVLRAMNIEAGMTVVDLGTGTGYFLPYLSEAVGTAGRVLALDVEPNLVEYARARATRESLENVRVALIGTNDPGLAAASVDRILVVNTWHHIEHRAAYAEKLRAALKPGGALHIVDFTKASPDGPPVELRLEPRQVIEEVLGVGGENSPGWRVAVSDDRLPRQYIVSIVRAP